MAREQDRQKFVLLANKRVKNTIRAIRLVGNLSNRSNYVYSEADVKKIFAVLQKEMKNARRRFKEGTDSREDEFRLV